MSNQGLTLKQAALAMKLSARTISRRIHAGKIKAEKIKGDWRIFAIPNQVTKEKPTGQTGQKTVQSVQTETSVDYAALLTKIDTLNREVGFWRGKYDELSKLLEPPAKLPWWKRILKKTAF